MHSFQSSLLILVHIFKQAQQILEKQTKDFKIYANRLTYEAAAAARSLKIGLI